MRTAVVALIAHLFFIHRLNQSCLNHRAAMQCFMHRAFVCDVQQPRPLLIAQLSLQPHLTAKHIALGCRGLARIAFADMLFVMGHIHADMLQRHALAPCIHANGHRCAGTQSNVEIVIGGWACVVTTNAFWLISN